MHIAEHRKTSNFMRSVLRKFRIFRSLPHIAALKDKYKGRRGFVIGNGPSLKITDLNKLKDEITIASNKVYLAFDQTQWRPSFLTCVDQLVWDKIQQDVFLHQSTVYLSSYLKLDHPRGKIYLIRHIGHVGTVSAKVRPIQFSDNLLAGCFGGSTVTYDNLQFAVHLGLNPIYIIGCDHYYEGETDTEALKPVAVTGKSNHFLPNYRQPGELVNPAPIAQMNLAYQEARRFSDKNKIKIYNATRGGHLDAFERVNFESIW